jgi:hypothetical protein
MKGNVKVAPPVSSKQFTFLADTNTFVGDISEVGNLHPLSEDPARYGFAMASAKTGAVASFYVSEIESDEDGISGWILKPTQDTMRHHPGLRGATVLVANT